ncbi:MULTISPECIES: hypothetical protein [Serratia]|uniref:Uncharacterized protein n=1 Tax=Serratia bockelmannii TaxID=2703793 RepID=A0ABT8LQF1_9GAMM|nr:MULTISPECIES: hypothetical protein [Serratia]MDN6879196.1 hypothetical protein [Serratia bockelmannii]NMT25731.1 hypothetical protein [Serratia marcescens]
MKAKDFNQRYAVGSHFIFRHCKTQFGGKAVKTVDVARDLKTETVVEINLLPCFVNTKSLTPTG